MVGETDGAAQEDGPDLQVTAPASELPRSGSEPAPLAPIEEEAAPLAAVRPDGSTGRSQRLSPVVRRLVRRHGIDINLVEGTGEGGRVTRRDVEAHIGSVSEAPPAVPVPDPPAPAAVKAAPGEEKVDLSRLRVRIGENMIRARQTAAHVWTSAEVDYERIVELRAAHRERFKREEGFSLTYLPFVCRAVIDALKAFPVVNSSFYLEERQAVFHHRVNLGIAVDLDQQGLVVVTMKDADDLGLTGLARHIRRLATAARSRRLGPDDLSGSTFTITNPGPYNSFMSAPIINIPNVAILSTDTVAKRPVVVTTPDGRDALAIRHIGYLGLSWDHRRLRRFDCDALFAAHQAQPGGLGLGTGTEMTGPGSVPMLRARWLGRLPYAEAWDLQRAIWNRRSGGQIADDYLLLLEHPHVYTVGRRGDGSHLLIGPERLSEVGAEFFRVDRGGDITYHGPGQLVGYPLIGINPGRVTDYVRSLEEALIATLSDLGVESWREQGLTGVWTALGKVAAIGVRVSRRVSMHGFALNLHPRMEYFGYINPCGITSRPVTSVRELTGRRVSLEEAVEAFIPRFAEVLVSPRQRRSWLPLPGDRAGPANSRWTGYSKRGRFLPTARRPPSPESREGCRASRSDLPGCG